MARGFPERKRRSDNDIMGTVTILCYYQNLHNLDRLFLFEEKESNLHVYLGERRNNGGLPWQSALAQ